jgi:putative flippase GtrA
VNIGLSQPLFGVKGMWAKILVSVAVMVLNYVFSKLIVFRNTGDKQ